MTRHAGIAFGILDEDGRAEIGHRADEALAALDAPAFDQLLDVLRFACRRVEPLDPVASERREDAGDHARAQLPPAGLKKVDGPRARPRRAQGIEEDPLEQQVHVHLLGT